MRQLARTTGKSEKENSKKDASQRKTTGGAEKRKDEESGKGKGELPQ